jgi:hypothetical protein
VDVTISGEGHIMAQSSEFAELARALDRVEAQLERSRPGDG